MWYDTKHDLRQLRTSVPVGVPPKRVLVSARGAAFCPKCGADNYWAFSFYEDDPTYCTHCEEAVNEIGYAAVDNPEQHEGRVFGDDAMDGAVCLNRRQLELLFGWNDDSPTGNNYEGSHDNDMGSLFENNVIPVDLSWTH